MKGILGILLLIGESVWGQTSATLHIIKEDSHQPIGGASVLIQGMKTGWISDSAGFLHIKDPVRGIYELRITCAGYMSREIKLTLPLGNKEPLSIALEPDMEVLGDVVVSSSRTNSRIRDLPTRVEVLGTEDMEEETSMHPSNVAMLLSEASGIQTQQTSASSGNIQIRILGLDGKYTQLLKDGFPMYSGFSNGLSIMQIPPLDLRQVELIKGSSSSLYGGDAIAGIINFISKQPSRRQEWNLLVNQTSRLGTDMGNWVSVRNKHWGFTLLNTFTHQEPADIHNEGFTVLPRQTGFTANPKVFWYPTDSILVSLALNATYDNRVGGDLVAVKEGASSSHPYLEKNKSDRNYYQLNYEQHFSGGRLLTLRNSVSSFSRDIGIMDYRFSGQQVSTFSEASYLIKWGSHTTVAGLNFITDEFKENPRTDSLIRDYHFGTTGVFVQDNWALGRRWVLETGLRNDYQNQYGNFLLPRISLLYKFSPAWSLRAGGELGYKPATIFDARTEETAYKNVLPIGSSVIAERSAGVNADLSYTGVIGEDTRLSVDQSCFYVQVSHPLELDSLSGSAGSKSFAYFRNASPSYTSRGFETSIRVRQDDWSLFAGYTYVDARTGVRVLPHIALTPGDKLVFDLSKEKDNDYRIALEAFYTGPQYLYDGTKTRDYWVTGLLVEKVIKRITLVLNFEDLTGTRQTRFGPVVIPPVTNPGFRDIYAPLEGFMINAAIKVRVW